MVQQSERIYINTALRPSIAYQRLTKPLMAPFNLVFLSILVCFINSATTEAQYDLNPRGYSCSNDKTNSSAFQLNLRTLLSYLSSNATANKEFYNTTASGKNPFATVYGLFMCTGDVPAELCSYCVTNATQSLSSISQCSLSNEGMILYEECMVRYSNRSFFSTPDFSTPSTSCSPFNVSNQASFERLFSQTLNQVIDEAANSTVGVKKYATKEARISGFQTLYCQAQCTPDLSPHDCRHCLNVTVAAVQRNCEGVYAFETNYNPSCSIRCDVYPFYRPSNAPAPSGLVPASNGNTDSRGPAYLSHNCSSNETTNSAFLPNLRTLLSNLSSKATTKTGFFKTTVDGGNPSDKVNGLFMCRGDVSPTLCQLCVQNAAKRISSECPSSKEAIIWYDRCLLRYSNRPLLSTVDDTSAPKFRQLTMANTSKPNLLQSFFTWTLASTLFKVEIKIRESATRNYLTRSVKLNGNQTLYTLGQCMPDLSDCDSCLENIIRYEIPWCCLASPEGKVINPSCYIMFGLSQFYRDGDEAEASGQASPPPTTTEHEKDRSRTIIVVVPIVVSAVLFSFCGYLLWKKARKSNYKTLLRKSFGDESTTLEGLQHDLAIIEAATNNFSHENKIGKGGFGEVYKGILPDGRHIAVKRLLKNSKQGLVEFKNEILLIAKLQQRNLVALIGFCLEEQEKILIYEFVPNGSLDYFLFGSQQQKLSWSERYKIIGGTALGILYLHEYSRLKVIHRDLKPSNVLLDENMNPKISDFGMARIVEIDQDRGDTNRIAGTFGYMSPEYAMFGQFSEKSDVFSFGVMILEIITGKRNINSYESHNVAESLISYVWRQWKRQTPLNILDPNMKENYSQNEVIECIQIGLLCVQENPNDRPTMTTIISYLNSDHSLELPSPREPAFFLHDGMDQDIIAQQEMSSGQSTNEFISFSINEMSTSEFYPRQ